MIVRNNLVPFSFHGLIGLYFGVNWAVNLLLFICRNNKTTEEYPMTKFECILCGLALNEYSDSRWTIQRYVGRGRSKPVWGFVSDSSTTDVMAMVAGYVLGKSFDDLATLIIEDRHLYSDIFEVDEEELGLAAEILTETLDGELEFVEGVCTDSMGKQTIIY